MTMRYGQRGITSFPASSRSKMSGAGHLSAVSHAGDVIAYLTTLTIYGAAAGSQFWIAEQSDLSNVVAAGVVPSDPFTVSLTATAIPMWLEVRIRKGTSGSKFLPLALAAKVTRNPSEFFVTQTIDPIV